MNLKNKVILAGLIGQEHHILSGKPTDDPEVYVYLLKNMEQKQNFSLWNIKMSDKEGKLTIWPYKGEDSDVLELELAEKFVETAFSESDETIADKDENLKLDDKDNKKV